ncbi:sensor histidine kinase [Crenothrix sp.]|uniref:sensor histidine kinase n=1 Tax=Crenothrix sp. TaxID=3100433 RepID=UPI00374D4871
MPDNNTDIIFPCPFSTGYGIPARQAWTLLKVFLGYRFVCVCLFGVLFYSKTGSSFLGSYDAHLYSYSLYGYFAVCILSTILVFWRPLSYSVQAQLLIFSDIIIFTLLMHACGGIGSGVGIMLAVSIAAGGLLVGGRCALVFAAMASLAVLAEQVYATITHSFVTTAYPSAGMLGASFFAIALLSFVLASRSEHMLKIATQQKKTIINLEELNRYIIQNLQSGIVIINPEKTIEMANDAALKLTHTLIKPQRLTEISELLESSFEDWLNDAKQDFVLLKLPNQLELHVRFTVLPTPENVYYLVTFENMAVYNQRVQQSKLASLGQLTASIAHEIRNPLGAISHAGQLLSENPDLSKPDLRLLEIIQNHSSRVNCIIEDILQLSRRGATTRDAISLQLWLKDYLEHFVIEHGASMSSFNLILAKEPLVIYMDPGHLKQIMDNLCRNALKYGNPDNGIITLRVYIYQQAPCIEIIDQGPGVKPDHIPRLFEPFFTTSSSGTGLGLYISKELAELNQATLRYYLTSDNHSCFRIFLMDANDIRIAI